MKSPKIEGYWYSDIHKEFPMPLPNVLNKEEAREIYNLIKLKEQDKKTWCLAYKGMSFSRLSKGISVGSEEFRTNDWIWPKGFAEHYVLQHKVKPTDEFLKFIGYKK